MAMGFIDKSLEFRQNIKRFVFGWIRPRVLALEQARINQNRELKEHWEAYTIEVYELIREVRDPDSNNKNDLRYIVFIDTDYDVDWITENENRSAEADKAISYAESIGARHCKHLRLEQILEFKRLIGQAIVNGLQNEAEYSRELADNAAQFLKDRTIERSRAWSLSSAHIALVLFSLLLSVVCGFSKNIPFLQSSDGICLWLAIQGGLIGAYLSIVQKTGRGEWDAAAGRALHYLEVSTTIFAGGVLGTVAFLISQSAFAPDTFKNLTPENYSSFVVGVTAGLFERFIPKMISAYSKFDKSGNP